MHALFFHGIFIQCLEGQANRLIVVTKVSTICFNNYSVYMTRYVMVLRQARSITRGIFMLFATVSKSAKTLSFLVSVVSFCEDEVFRSYKHFLETLSANSRETAQNCEIRTWAHFSNKKT
jgi:hypothetical protein